MAKIMGRKVGMTHLFSAEGERLPVTIIDASSNVVIEKKTTEKDGYSALKVGHGDQKSYRLNKPDLGQFKKRALEPKRFVKELRLPDAEIAGYDTGSEVKVDVFAEGQFVDVTGTSKGKGHAGVMKRHNMGGGRATHGAAFFHRHGGSIGTNMTPGRTLPNLKMGGQYGDETVSILNLKVARVDAEKNLLMVEGGIPGSRNSLVLVRHGVKGRERKKR
jgi:large subunit ribosomal protein L3